MGIVLVMIDLDNTLNDREAAFRAWAAEQCAERGLDRSSVDWIVEVDEDGYGDRAGIQAAIFERLGWTGPTGELQRRYREGIRRHLVESTGATACLEALRAAGHTVVVVTNGGTEPQHHKIDVLGFRDLVDGVVVSEEAGVAKPDPAIFELAARSVGGELDGGWMVGDAAVNDVVAAGRLGLRTAWIQRGRTWDPSLPPPTVTVGSVGELAAVIDRQPGA